MGPLPSHLAPFSVSIVFRMSLIAAFANFLSPAASCPVKGVQSHSLDGNSRRSVSACATLYSQIAWRTHVEWRIKLG